LAFIKMQFMRGEVGWTEAA